MSRRPLANAELQGWDGKHVSRTLNPFEDWLAALSTAGIELPSTANPTGAWRDWLSWVYENRGALSPTDLLNVMDTEQDRLSALTLASARRLLSEVLADAATIGMHLDIQLALDDWGGLRVLVRYGHRLDYKSASNGPGLLPFVTEGDLLVWLADEIQEVSMERDQVDVWVWPVCPEHRLGTHARHVDGVAVWWCNGAEGHVLARIGQLDATTS